MKEETYRLVMMIGLWIGIILFLMAIIVLAKNIQEIKNDPMLYGMDKHGLEVCTCADSAGRTTTIVLEDFRDKFTTRE